MTIHTRIFLGYLQNKEMKIHLHESKQWKEEKLLGMTHLIEVYLEDQPYIGVYAVKECLTCREIKEIEKKIKIQLQLYCPKINLDRHSAHLFSQTFIA